MDRNSVSCYFAFMENGERFREILASDNSRDEKVIRLRDLIKELLPTEWTQEDLDARADELNAFAKELQNEDEQEIIYEVLERIPGKNFYFVGDPTFTKEVRSSKQGR